MNQPRGRQFQQGNKFGRGRPRGSRNRPKFPGQHGLDERSEALMRKCVGQAMQGDRTAMKICMDRVSQTGSKSPIRMKLPPVKTLQDVDQAAERVMQDVARGKLTPADGEKM